MATKQVTCKEATELLASGKAESVTFRPAELMEALKPFSDDDPAIVVIIVDDVLVVLEEEQAVMAAKGHA